MINYQASGKLLAHRKHDGHENRYSILVDLGETKKLTRYVVALWYFDGQSEWSCGRYYSSLANASEYFENLPKYIGC